MPVSRGAHIYGEIAGYGSTCEAFHRVRLEECGEEPARAIGLALEEAGVPADAIDYIQYHGTSTELNDRIETRAVKLAFGRHANEPARIVHQEHHRASSGRVRRGRQSPRHCWRCATESFRQRSMSKTPIRNAISIMCRKPAVRWKSNTPWRTASPSEARTQLWY